MEEIGEVGGAEEGRGVDRQVRTVDDLLHLLDGLFTEGGTGRGSGAARWWDAFYADRSRQVPFFVAAPDESLASYLERGLLRPGRALDLGCGPGRNALHLASRGFEVTAVDLSASALRWAADRAREAGVAEGVTFLCGDAFALLSGPGPVPGGPYDLIHDSGFFHHLPPHRRISYLSLLDTALAPGGHFSLTCFAAHGDEGGSCLSDAELYRGGSLHGGLAYTPSSLRHLFRDLEEVELRRMRHLPEDSAHFGKAFLWTALFRKPVRRPRPDRR